MAFDVDTYCKEYGTELGEVLFHANVKFRVLQQNFFYYSNLFGKSKERVDLLNSVAGSFFSSVQDLLHDEILLSISRLTDPAGNNSKKNPKFNVSILRIHEIVGSKHLHLHSQLETIVAIAVNASLFAREIRNQRISHTDVEVALGKTVVRAGVSIVEMRTSIQSIFEVFGFLNLQIRDVHLSPGLIGSRSEFGLLRALFEAKHELNDVSKRLYQEARSSKTFQVYPPWLLGDDEESNWKF